ncbi:MBL fold metallo-hydrolase [Nitrospirillum iridis]|uniref:Glyoxylase-like metal-dependent hydrolase (Beta-lactamase superfamily II) n=1 Tax=Nitrospirillum iridis TaxID=765888 RepID=A0A7X0EET0_9PROT|nr:MBL fold metallo-hydrolase [Nitrospirillum iridis]MBB6251759.1 glyoxylase-like metal-dependent hydrolase (beta-lactamase superfamily II) [Nitrospirillum iridis]
MHPDVQAFFDTDTNTVSYLVADPATRAAAIIDSVLDFDPKSGRTSTASADRLIGAVRARGLTVDWILETHVHADHLTAAPYLQAALGGKIGIGAHVRQVQRVFRGVFNLEPAFQADGRPFDHLFEDGEGVPLGSLAITALHTPGHTPADVTYRVGDAAFVGDTLFQPDYGTARTDFPGGDARQLYRSIRRILALPPETRLFTGHDYKAPGRDVFVWESTVAAQRAANVHVHDGVDEDRFVALRTARDAGLDMPRLLLPSVQVNVRAGHFPPPEDNGIRYLKIPLNAL